MDNTDGDLWNDTSLSAALIPSRLNGLDYLFDNEDNFSLPFVDPSPFFNGPNQSSAVVKLAANDGDTEMGPITGGVVILLGIILSLLTGGMNLMVMISIRIDRQLQTISNYFLFSLAVADAMIGLISIPFFSVYIVDGRWNLGYTTCLFWLCIDYLMSNASVYNLLLISFDRYFSVTRPLTYRPRRTTRKALIMIASTYVISLILWPPWIISWPYIENDWTAVRPDECTVQFLKTNVSVTIGTILAAFYLPVAIIVFLYARVYYETRRRHAQFGTLQAAFTKSTITRPSAAAAAATASRPKSYSNPSSMYNSTVNNNINHNNNNNNNLTSGYSLASTTTITGSGLPTAAETSANHQKSQNSVINLMNSSCSGNNGKKRSWGEEVTAADRINLDGEKPRDNKYIGKEANYDRDAQHCSNIIAAANEAETLTPTPTPLNRILQFIRQPLLSTLRTDTISSAEDCFGGDDEEETAMALVGSKAGRHRNRRVSGISCGTTTDDEFITDTQIRSEDAASLLNSTNWNNVHHHHPQRSFRRINDNSNYMSTTALQQSSTTPPITTTRHHRKSVDLSNNSSSSIIQNTSPSMNLKWSKQQQPSSKGGNTMTVRAIGNQKNSEAVVDNKELNVMASKPFDNKPFCDFAGDDNSSSNANSSADYTVLIKLNSTSNSSSTTTIDNINNEDPSSSRFSDDLLPPVPPTKQQRSLLIHPQQQHRRRKSQPTPLITLIEEDALSPTRTQVPQESGEKQQIGNGTMLPPSLPLAADNNRPKQQQRKISAPARTPILRLDDQKRTVPGVCDSDFSNLINKDSSQRIFKSPSPPLTIDKKASMTTKPSPLFRAASVPSPHASSSTALRPKFGTAMMRTATIDDADSTTTVDDHQKIVGRGLGGRKKRKRNERDSKAAKTLSAILLVFILTWMPYSVFVVIESWKANTVPPSWWTISYYLCYINSTLNPLCYALCNPNFRRTYLRILQCKCASSSSINRKQRRNEFIQQRIRMGAFMTAANVSATVLNPSNSNAAQKDNSTCCRSPSPRTRNHQQQQQQQLLRDTKNVHHDS